MSATYNIEQKYIRWQISTLKIFKKNYFFSVARNTMLDKVDTFLYLQSMPKVLPLTSRSSDQ